jgi:tetratricopeptide (TPR) repeat protein
MKKTATVFGILIALALSLPAQDYKGKGRLSGIVTDMSGAPLEGVTVKLFHTRAQGGLTVTTDKSGKWLAAWIRSGGWNLDFSKVGYAPKKISVEISENKKNPEVEITLTKIEGLALTDDIMVQLGRGNELFDKGDFAGALAVYEKLIADNPDAYPIHMNIGNCHFAQEQYDLAEASYLKVLEKDTQNPGAIIAIGNCHANRGESDKAMEWYGKIEFEKITDATVLYNLGTNYYNGAKFEEALKFYRRAYEMQKDSVDALYQLGLTYINLQKNAEAVAAFEDYLKLDPDSERAAQVKGFLEYLKKR